MRITDLFIRRPVLALVVNLIIIIAGLQAIRTLNVRQYPRSENASVTVSTVYVGASADLVRGFITTPLERAIAAADGIEYMESQSTLGLSTITIRLKINYDSTKALAEISSKVDQVRRDLPPEAEVPVINIESADSQFASAYLSFSSDILKQNEITEYLVRIVQPRLSAIEGVQRADILGAQHHVGDVAQPHDGSVCLPHGQGPELVDRLQVGVRRQVDLNVGALALPERGEEVGAGQGLAHLGGAHVEGGHPVGLEPDAHGKGAGAEDVGPLYASNGR